MYADQHPLARVVGGSLGGVPAARPSSQGQASALGGAALGIYAKSSAVCTETGEITASGYDPVAVRCERFALQSAARRILPKSRTAKCLRFVQKHRAGVEVWRSKEHQTAHFGGLQTCGSVWACPVCAAKISERRRLELLGAMEAHQSAGGGVLLLTLTNPHKLGDRLGEILSKQQKAMSRFTGDYSAKALRASIGCIGTVRAWEVTHGANGWHPHFHLLLFVRSGLDLGEVAARAYAVWANSCRLAGLPIPSREHGVRVDDGRKAAEYVSKGLWGLDREMTKGHMKKARAGSSPFDLLRAVLEDGDRQAAARFQEFAEAFKGKRQLVWSQGLKALFAVDDLTDEQVSAVQDDSAAFLGEITLEQWRAVLRLDLRGEVLELARFGWEPVQRLLDSLPRNVRGAPNG